MKKILLQFLDDENGTGTLEYVLVILLMATTVPTVSSGLKTSASYLIKTIGTKLTSSVNTFS